MRKEYTFSLLTAALLICGACSNVRQAPVENRQAPPAVPEPAVSARTEPAAAPPGPAAGRPAREEEDALWEELPGSAESAATAAPAETGRFSDNPAVMALLDDTDLMSSRGDPEAAAVSVERALRLEPKNPWLWHRLAALKLELGQWRLAAALAQKSNSLSAGRPALRRANADLVKRAEEQQRGDLK